MADIYKWSLVLTAFILVVLSVVILIMPRDSHEAPLWIVVAWTVVALYTVVGIFITGRDRE